MLLPTYSVTLTCEVGTVSSLITVAVVCVILILNSGSLFFDHLLCCRGSWWRRMWERLWSYCLWQSSRSCCGENARRINAWVAMESCLIYFLYEICHSVIEIWYLPPCLMCMVRNFPVHKIWRPQALSFSILYPTCVLNDDNLNDMTWVIWSLYKVSRITEIISCRRLESKILEPVHPRRSLLFMLKPVYAHTKERNLDFMWLISRCNAAI